MKQQTRWLIRRKETYYNPRLNYVPGSWDDYAKGYEAKNDPYNGPNRKEYYMRTKPWQPYQGYEQNISFP